MKLQFIANSYDACTYHRIVLPVDCMQGVELEMCKGDESNLGDADLVLVSRDSLTNLQDIKARGAKVILDVDDYWELPEHHPLHSIWYSGKHNECFVQNIKNADMVWVTNRQLKDKVLAYNPNVHVIPNALPYGQEQFKCRKIKPVKKPVTFIYAGGSSHKADIELLSPAFIKIGVHPHIHEISRYILAGVAEGPNWDAMRQVFMYTHAAEFISAAPLDKYIKSYKEADVALIPLVDSEFSCHKSILKILEAASQQIPCIVSDVLPYNELKGVPGLLFVSSEEEWFKHIRYFINYPQEARKLGKQLHDYCKKHYDLQYWTEKRVELMKTL